MYQEFLNLQVLGSVPLSLWPLCQWQNQHLKNSSCYWSILSLSETYLQPWDFWGRLLPTPWSNHLYYQLCQDCLCWALNKDNYIRHQVIFLLTGPCVQQHVCVRTLNLILERELSFSFLVFEAPVTFSKDLSGGIVILTVPCKLAHRYFHNQSEAQQQRHPSKLLLKLCL